MADAPQEKCRRRWFRLTPGRVVLGLLAVEVFLLLSERFEWLTLNGTKVSDAGVRDLQKALPNTSITGPTTRKAR